MLAKFRNLNFFTSCAFLFVLATSTTTMLIMRKRQRGDDDDDDTYDSGYDEGIPPERSNRHKRMRRQYVISPHMVFVPTNRQ